MSSSRFRTAAPSVPLQIPESKAAGGPGAIDAMAGKDAAEGLVESKEGGSIMARALSQVTKTMIDISTFG